MAKKQHKLLRKRGVRARVIGSAQRPRLSLCISNTHISAQIIDDTQHKTLATTTTVGKKKIGDSMTEKAAWVGNDIGKRAKSLKLKNVVFDRNGKKFHGRARVFADSVRKAGLEF